MTETESRAGRALLGVAIFALIACGLYWPAITGYFQADDFELIGRIYSEGWFATWGRYGFLRPVVVATYWLDVAAFDRSPLGFHLTNVAFHAANSIGVVLLARALFEHFDAPHRDRQSLAAACGALFLVMPCHSESVAWIAGRTDVVATSFALVSLLAYFRFRERQSGWALLISATAFGLALLSKEVTVVLPFVVLGLEICRADAGRVRLRRPGVASGLLLIVLVAYLAIRSWLFGSPVDGYVAYQHLDWSRVFERSQLWPFAVRSLRPPFARYADFEAIALWKFAAIAGLAGLGAVTLRWRTPGPTLVLGCVAAFCISLATALPIGVDVVSTQGERFLYLPTVFSSIGVVSGVALLLRRRMFWAPALLLYGVYSASSLWNLNQIWGDASGLAREVAQTVAETQGDADVVVINVPDNYRGAYVLRGSLPSAIDVFSGVDRTREIFVISTHDLHALDAEVKLERAGQHAREYTISLLEKGSRFHKLRANPHVTVEPDDSNRSFRMRYKRVRDCPVEYWFSRGRLQRLASLCPRRRS